MLPLCFILMPFGQKTDSQGKTTDFDAVYNDVIAPAVRQANLDPIRADEEQVGGTIHKPMFERLMLCEYAVADVTGANPNVYYELGIRHALRPHSTVILFAAGTTLPFDLAPLRGLPYKLGVDGRPVDVDVSVAAIAARLATCRHEPADDSPLFQLVADMPRHDVDHQKTDVFREHVAHTKSTQDRIKQSKSNGRAAVVAMAQELTEGHLRDAGAAVVVDLYLALRDVKAYDEMVSLYDAMPTPLQRNRMVREQLGFALNRLGGREKAADVLNAVLTDCGASSETYGLLGRVYKDWWDDEVKAGNPRVARSHLDKAINTYLAGFEADWRDAFPGVNAVTLMEMQDKPDPRQAEILPIVRFAARQTAKAGKDDYWDHATLFELAVLARDEDAADLHLGAALTKLRHRWEAETTIRNLRLILDVRTRRGEASPWLATLIDDLDAAKMKLPE